MDTWENSHPKPPGKLLRALGVALKTGEVCLVVSAAALLIVTIGAEGELKQATVAELTDLRRVTLSIGGTAAEIRESAKVARAASVEQKAYFQGISSRAQTVLENSAAATAALTAMIHRTDDSINTVLAPALAQTVTANDARMTQLIADTDETVKSMAATSTQATAAMAAATKVLGDPAIAAAMKNTDATTANLEAMTGHLNNSAALVETKVRQMTKPASWAKNVGMTILDIGAKVGSVFAGFVQ